MLEDAPLTRMNPEGNFVPGSRSVPSHTNPPKIEKLPVDWSQGFSRGFLRGCSGVIRRNQPDKKTSSHESQLTGAN